jgi:hypothetical protein
MFRHFIALTLLVSACGGGGGTGASPPPETDCSISGNCTAIAIAGDPPASNPGTFRGYADPNIAHDPAVADRLWLAYSWPHVVSGHAPGGAAVQMGAVETHLARSDDGGVGFSYIGTLWPDFAAPDPEGSGETGIISSETASLATIESGGNVTWYGAHLRYFLEPQNGYHPKYGTSWQVRIGAASSPAGLASATETVLGVSTTADVYNPAVRLDQLAGLPIQHCALLNNPALFARNGTLYLIVECLAFIGTTPDYANSTAQVFATVPSGAPTSWSWRYAGQLADHSVAVALSDDTIQQPDVSLAADGTPIALFTPAHADADVVVGTVGDGCAALKLRSIDPPALARDSGGHLVVRARIDGSGIGACTHDRASSAGIIATGQDAGGGNWVIRASGLRP